MAPKHQFLLWAPFKTGPDFVTRWDAHVRAHTTAGMVLVAEGHPATSVPRTAR